MISDEALMAYLDGEAGAASERAIEAAMATDPGLRARLEMLESGDRNLRAAFDTLLDEPVPDKIVQLVRTQAPGRRPAPARKPGPAGWLGAAADSMRRSWGASPAWLGWAAAAQFALLLVAAGALVQMSAADRAPQYHALGSAPPSAAPNLTVIFRPDTPERALRETLQGAGARIVGGPTSADAYLLQVPAAGRDRALAALRADAAVAMAEPLDTAETPR